MSDPVIVALIIRGILSFALVIVGGWCVYLGWRLLFSKAHRKSESSFEATIGSHEFSFSAGTAGTAIVFTSAAWMFGAVLTAPDLESSTGATVAFGPEIINTTGVESIAAIEFKGNRVSLSKAQIKDLESFASYLKTIEIPPNIILEGYS